MKITASLIIMMCLVFILVFLFVRTIDNRKWLTVLVSLLVTPFVYFYVWYPMITIFSNYHHQRYFSLDIWNEEPSLRYELSDDMMASNILIGQSKATVKSSLGESEWLSWNNSTKSHSKNKWNYGLGIEPGALNSKKECLELVFNKDRLVSMNQYQEELNLDAKD